MAKTMKVVFRTFRDGQVIALFPEQEWSHGKRDMVSYMHVGQHAAADMGVVSKTRLATKDEYAPLLAELRAIGYDRLQVGNRVRRIFN